jgi:acetyl-CoA decarbonylase/synthase complex subunit delta
MKEVLKLGFEIPKQPYSGKIGETTIGKGKGAVTLGGSDAYPFHNFEGSMPNPPKIAMEVWDYDPSKEWPAAAVEPFKDVISSPDTWAKKCVNEYGADIIVLQLKSTDPNGMDRQPDEAAKVAKKVLDAVDVPVFFWGTANNQKDEEVLKKISELCEGKNVSLGPVEEGNHKGVGASALGYNQTIIASSPIDVNLAKQLNILLGNLGVKSSQIIIDPTTGGLGYGLEYSYSVMERIRMAALTQEDDKLQIPMVSNIGNEIWKCKEAGESIEEAPTLGDPEKRGILMEAVAATDYLLAGSDVVILRHPESVRVVRSFIERLLNGGAATDVPAISKNLETKEVDLVALAPKPNLDFSEAAPEAKPAKPKAEKAAAPPKGEEKPKAAAPAAPKEEEKPKAAAAAKKEEKAEAKPPAAPKEEKPKAATAAPAEKPKEKVVELKPKAAKAEEAAKEAEAKAKAEAEAEAKAAAAQKEKEEKAKAEAAKAAEEEAAEKEKAKAAAAKAKVEAKTKEKEELQALRQKRALEREKLEAEREAREGEKVQKTPAEEQFDLVDRLISNLNRIHRRG